MLGLNGQAGRRVGTGGGKGAWSARRVEAGSSGANAGVLAAIAAGVVASGGGAWFARRRVRS